MPGSAPVADDPAQPAAQDTHQPDAVPSRQAVEPLDDRMQQLGIGRKGDGLRLHRRVDRDPLEVLAAQRAGLMRHPQALGQQPPQLVAKPLAPVTQVASLVQEGVLEELTAEQRNDAMGQKPPSALAMTVFTKGHNDIAGAVTRSPRQRERAVRAEQ